MCHSDYVVSFTCVFFKRMFLDQFFGQVPFFMFKICGKEACRYIVLVVFPEKIVMNNRKLFVGNVGYSVTENELRDLFAQVGNVESVNIVKDKFTGNSRGFAFVEMSSSDEARQAVQDLNNKDVGGRSLKVSEARSRENRDSNGNGNRGGFSRR